MTDLETAARELAEQYANRIFNTLEDSDARHRSFKAGFLAGAAHMQKRIEELEGEVDMDYFLAESDKLREIITKEREISKLLEEGLTRAIRWTEVDVKEKTVTVEQWEDLYLVRETLAEVQKLRGE